MVCHHRDHCKKAFASANASAQQDNCFAQESLKGKHNLENVLQHVFDEN